MTNSAAAAAPGTTFSVTDTVLNRGIVPAGASTTRYYLSVDAVKSAGDILLTGTRAVVTLAAGASATGSRTEIVPTTTPTGTYVLLACADDLNRVIETDETNNCRRSDTTVAIGP